jgi:putative menaquinone biosynthesis radical SAM enzyme/dehypoxanthine futalosine cyclase
MAVCTTDPVLARLADKVARGERIEGEEAVHLFQTDDVLGLGALAGLARQKRHGRRAYYTLNRHIDYTNICVLGRACKFCAFARTGREPGAFVLSPEDVLRVAQDAAANGATELHIVGGLHPELPISYFEEMLGLLRAHLPHVQAKALTAVEVAHVARVSNISLDECLLRLKEAGLGSISGGGAEIFADRVRSMICPGKMGAEEWLGVMRAAHRLGIRSNATMLYGHIETPEERAEHLLRLRALQDETGGFAAFVPLPFQPRNNELGKVVPHFTTGLDDLRTMAASRLILDNFEHIKAYWVMLGVKMAQVALNFGADDLDGTVTEERVAHDAGARTPQLLTEQELVGLITEAGFEPVLRNSACPDARQSVGATGRSPLRVVRQTTVFRSGEFAQAALDDAFAGHRLDGEQLVALFSADLLELGSAADHACRRLHPEPVRTFVIDCNINYSNICSARCRFCAFWREPHSPEAYTRTHQEIVERVGRAVQQGATQILIQGGLHPSLSLELYKDILRAIKARFAVHLHSFSPPEIVHFARSSGLGISDVLSRLKDAGLDSLPGGGAEILVDSVRGRLSGRAKCSADEWFEVMRTAHSLGLPTTATMMFGHIETIHDRVAHLLRLRELQDETGQFTAFIPWTYQPQNTALGGQEAGGADYLRTLAISRLALDNLANVQASWLTQGEKIGQIALCFGADDIGGTILEENVVTAAGVEHQPMSPDELARLIRDAGFQPAQRDTYYHILRHM